MRKGYLHVAFGTLYLVFAAWVAVRVSFDPRKVDQRVVATAGGYEDAYFYVQFKGPNLDTSVSVVDLRQDLGWVRTLNSRGLQFMRSMSRLPIGEKRVLQSSLVRWAGERVIGPGRSQLQSASLVMNWRPQLLYADDWDFPYISEVVYSEPVNLGRKPK